MTYRFIVKPLTHCATLLGGEIGKETSYMITLHVIVYLDNNTSQLVGVLYHLKVIFAHINIKKKSLRTPFYDWCEQEI